jgi:hypothetical protein
MISSLSNNTPAQSKLYQQISLKERQNFKGYFSKAANLNIKKNSIDPHSILNRESKQMSTNASMNSNYKNNIDQQRKSIAQSDINSIGFEQRLIKFHSNNKNIRILAKEIEVVLKTFEAGNIASIATELGIPIESGFNKKYLIEDIKSVICAYVENELLLGGVGQKNVYIRQTPSGLESIKRILRFTSFSILATDKIVSVKDLQKMSENVTKMREVMKGAGIFFGLGKFSSSKLDKQIGKRDNYLDRVKERESKGKGTTISNVFRKKKNRSKFRLKDVMAGQLYEFLQKTIGGGNTDDLDLTNINKTGGGDFSFKNSVATKVDEDAIRT